MLARHMYIFEAKYIPIVATLKHKAVDMERQCGSTFFLQQFDHFIKILFTYASVLFFSKNVFKIVSFYRKLK